MRGTSFVLLNMVHVQVKRRHDREEMNISIGMLVLGLSRRQMGHHLGVSQSVIGMILQHYLTHEVHADHACGRKRSTSDTKDRFIVQERRNLFQNTTMLRNVRKRLEWAYDHVRPWTLQNQAPELISEESKFCMDFTSSIPGAQPLRACLGRASDSHVSQTFIGNNNQTALRCWRN